MSMDYIRRSYGVPAKRGMTVKPKIGPAKGLLGYIRGSRDSRLVVAGTRGRNPAWVCILHPDDVDFLVQTTLVSDAP